MARLLWIFFCKIFKFFHLPILHSFHVTFSSDSRAVRPDCAFVMRSVLKLLIAHDFHGFVKLPIRRVKEFDICLFETSDCYGFKTKFKFCRKNSIFSERTKWLNTFKRDPNCMHAQKKSIKQCKLIFLKIFLVSFTLHDILCSVDYATWMLKIILIRA